MPSVLAPMRCVQEPVTADGVELRLVDLTGEPATVTRAEGTLAPHEVARARRGTPAVHRRRVLLRAALREALAAGFGLAPADVPIATTDTGRPYVPGRPDVDASCSASGALGLVAVARGRRVGVDVERIRPWSPDLDGDWLTEDEHRALMALPVHDRDRAATRCWTQKEAVLKGLGCGLLEPLSSVATVVGRLSGDVRGWRIADVEVPDGWVACLATAPLEEDDA